jgi:hypothetical protein
MKVLVRFGEATEYFDGTHLDLMHLAPCATARCQIERLDPCLCLEQIGGS